MKALCLRRIGTRLITSPPGRVPLRRVPLRSLPVRRVPLRRLPVRRVPLRRLPLRRVPLRRVPLRGFPLRRAPLRRLLPLRQSILRKLIMLVSSTCLRLRATRSRTIVVQHLIRLLGLATLSVLPWPAASSWAPARNGAPLAGRLMVHLRQFLSLTHRKWQRQTRR